MGSTVRRPHKGENLPILHSHHFFPLPPQHLGAIIPFRVTLLMETVANELEGHMARTDVMTSRWMG